MMRGLMMELKAENISFSYHKKKPILKDVSLSLNSNQIIGLIGDSGSGKSTLCKIISGYISNYDGEVTIDVPYQIDDMAVTIRNDQGVVLYSTVIPSITMQHSIVLPDTVDADKYSIQIAYGDIHLIGWF
jgi:ABC-type bacteriocin/lantibiotic exporter with double-glycine peptidase domain